MTKYLLEMFGISLGLTLVLELAVARVLGLKNRRYILVLILVNLLTNPPAVLLHWLGVPQIPLEIAVVLVEAGVYRLFAGEESWDLPKPVWLSLICNGVSWGTGILISQMGG